MEESYMKESYKSYQRCLAANSARKNSLTKKTTVIEVERKLASNQMDREERQLREHLKQMRIEHTKTTIGNGCRDKTDGETKQHKVQSLHPYESRAFSCIDPYPVTFASVGSTNQVPRQRSNTMEEKGLKYAARRDRRISKEFEDLCLNTTTGKLAIPTYLLLHPLRSLTTSTTPPSSSPPRKMSTSRSSLDSGEMSHWPGDPEAISSVRRPRKTVEQQDKGRIMRLIGDLFND